MDNNNKNTDRQTGLWRRTLAPSIQLHYSLQPPSYTRVSAHCLRTQCHTSVTGLYIICSSSRTKWPVHKPDHCTVSSAELNTWRCTCTLTYILHGILLNLRNNVVTFHSFSFIFNVCCLTMYCKHYTVSVINDLMSVEHWWNDNDSGNGNTRRKKSVPVPLCVPKSHTGWPGVQPMPRQGQRVTACLPQPWHNPTWTSQGHIPCRPHFVTARFPHLKATDYSVNKTIL